MLSFFPRGVLDEILNLIESVSEDFPSYSYNQCKCLAINKNGFRLLMIFWRKQEEYTFFANIRSMFLIFVTPQKKSANAYELFPIFGDYVTMITNWWRMAFSAHLQAHSAWCKSTIKGMFCIFRVLSLFISF